ARHAYGAARGQPGKSSSSSRKRRQHRFGFHSNRAPIRDGRRTHTAGTASVAVRIWRRAVLGLSPGPVVNTIDIRGYGGDFHDIAEFTRRVWTAMYGGKMWFPVWDANCLRWQFGANGRALSTAAYDGPRLVGSFLLARHALRIGRSV